MNQTRTGGPAFPTICTSNNVSTTKITSPEAGQVTNEYMTYQSTIGLSIRDYFAAKALQGLLASSEFNNFERYASAAYTAADAMIEQREKQ